MSGTETAAEKRFEELTDLFDAHPLAYAGYRVWYLRSKNRNISESGEIPFVSSAIFPVLLGGYLVVARFVYLFDRVRGGGSLPNLDSDGHLFSMTSTRGYRTQTFLEVAQACQDRGEEVVFLCSPATAEGRREWEASGFSVVSHRELHGHVGIIATFGGLVYAVRTTLKVWTHEDVAADHSDVRAIFNFIFLEYVKRESVRPLTRASPAIHTFSPMPYLIDATAPRQVFVYQHGIQPPLGDKIMAAPFFVPLTYLLWGEPWRGRFERNAHSGSDIRVVGSPWYERLAEKRVSATDPQYDVLFVSGSHDLTDDSVETAFETLVARTIETCESQDLRLAVKLHPLEDPDWFANRGWDEYIEDFDDIDQALLDSRLAVTNASTAFVESAVLGVPVVVADLWKYGLSELAPVDYVRFTDGPDVGGAIRAAMDGQSFQSERARSLVDLDGATERIVEVIDETRNDHD